MILVLGKGISGDGVHQFLNRYGIEHHYLNTEQVQSLNYQLIVKSPGISYDVEIIASAKKKGIRIISDIELISMILNREFIGITGTNGKTTTTMLVYQGLMFDYEARICGNIGYSIGAEALDSTAKTIFVCELSSFQLMGIKNFKPRIAVILNLSPAHQDWHHSLEEYYQAKLRILRCQDHNDTVVYNYDDEYLRKNIKTVAKRYSFSTKYKHATCYYEKGVIYYQGKKQFKIKNEKTSPSNYLAAFIVLKIMGIKKRTISRSFNQFNGIEYRLQEIIPNVYNDAKATNPQATINAIKTINKKVVLIVGGKLRNEDLSPLDEVIDKIQKVYAYGEAKEFLKNYCKKKQIECYTYTRIDEIVPVAICEPGIILYSPMFASYDQFVNYEERGKLFTKLVLQEKPHCSLERNHS